MELENNRTHLGMSKGFQTGGINNPIKRQNSYGGQHDLANSLGEGRTRTDIKKKGPKMCPANKASSRPMSHILSRIIYKLLEGKLNQQRIY